MWKVMFQKNIVQEHGQNLITWMSEVKNYFTRYTQKWNPLCTKQRSINVVKKGQLDESVLNCKKGINGEDN